MILTICKQKKAEWWGPQFEAKDFYRLLCIIWMNFSHAQVHSETAEKVPFNSLKNRKY